MGITGLSLPTEIPWERLCVTQDMMDLRGDDNSLPPKWMSSIALYKYVPDDSYQVYPSRRLTYLKVVCTIAGYQLKDQEVEGQINWNGVNTRVTPILEDAIETYLPCHGAILQLTVTPPSVESVPSPSQILAYPYIMDIQPKKRELFEAASDTKETASRSLDDMNIRKAGGTTNSSEVLDGISEVISSDPSKYGSTKQLTTTNSLDETTTDKSREARETLSHTTQISQLYHLLDTYHVGTNRAVFFIQPRPHTVEEPTYFVNGPREIEGMQEFFVVINQPKDQSDFCVSIRLDTSHLTWTYIPTLNCRFVPDPKPHFLCDGISFVPNQPELLIATRGLRCCTTIEPPTVRNIGTSQLSKEGIVGMFKLETPLSQSGKTLTNTATDGIASCSVPKASSTSEPAIKPQPYRSGKMITIREANDINRSIRSILPRSLFSRRRVEPGTISILDLEILVNTLLYKISQTAEGDRILNESILDHVPNDAVKKLEDYFGRKVQDITRRELLGINNTDLSSIIGLDESSTNRLKLALLEVPMQENIS